MKTETVIALFVVLTATIGVSGCTSPCEVIVDKMNECQGTNVEPNPNCDSDRYDCQADCYEDASCEDLTDSTSAFFTCMNACG